MDGRVTMQIKNINIFSASSSQATLYGNWIDVSNLVSMSVEVVGLEAGSAIWIEVSNDPNVNIDGANSVNAPATPVLGQSPAPNGGGLIGQGTYFVKLTYITQWGETVASSEASLAVADGNVLSIAAPGIDAGGLAIGYMVYASKVTNTETLQNGPKYVSAFTIDLTPGYHYTSNTSIPVNRPYFLPAGLQSTNGPVPPVASTAGGLGVGINAIPPDPTGSTQNLTAYCVASPKYITDAPIAIIGQASGTIDGATVPAMAMWAPACMAWKWVRVCKTGGTAATTAYIVGQNG